MILLDTSVLIDSLTSPGRSAASLRRAIADGERILVPTLVLYEWLRGPRRPEELAAQEALFPRESAVPFAAAEAALAAGLYARLRKARGREIDLALAACALVRNATLWTLNTEDFDDIPDLEVSAPEPT
ncbi:MAG: type II toxin-antitoxin system VapC family toxin [Thermoanaerobaculia bacterium]